MERHPYAQQILDADKAAYESVQGMTKEQIDALLAETAERLDRLFGKAAA